MQLTKVLLKNDSLCPHCRLLLHCNRFSSSLTSFLLLHSSGSSIALNCLPPCLCQHGHQDNSTLPSKLVGYGPDTNCTLQVCPIDSSALEYRLSLAASGTVISLFALTMAIHIAQGVRWKTWGFMVAMLLGCVDEIVGYSGRIMLYYNPFSFGGFLLTRVRQLEVTKHLVTRMLTELVLQYASPPLLFSSAPPST
jgi:hypothetical protein